MRTSKRTWLVGTTLPILAVLGLNACKDTLNNAAQPQGTLSAAVLSTKAGVEGSLIATYRALDFNSSITNNAGWGNAASDWVWASVTSDDAYKGSVPTDQPPVTDIELYQWSTAQTDGYLNDKWRGAYEGVSRANATLNLLKTVQAQAGAIPAAEVSSIAGEAIFLRAHFHFSAWRVFGNIPYYREGDTDFRKPNETSDQVIADILKDLDSAMVLLPAAPWNGDKGRVSKWTAEAYKGRVQAYAGQWPQALTTLRDVQASGPYKLETSFDHVWTAFQAYANGPETILAYQASVNDGDPNGSNANWGERLNFPYSGSYYQCCGFHQPSQNLVNFFAVDPTTGLPAALTNANWNANDNNFVAGSSTPVDPRLDWTVGRDGVPFKDAGIPDVSWNRDRGYGGPYHPKKNAQEIASGGTSTVGWTPNQLNSVKMHIFRYADLLLLLAEAEVEAGSLENARVIVNQIRARAGQTAQGCGAAGDSVAYPTCKGDTRIAVPINDPSIKWAAYKVGQYTAPWTDQAQARTAVRYERRLELAMEGQRFFDLKRWGIAQQTLNDYLAVEKNRRAYLSAASPFTARNLLFPIPSVQIELSKVGSTSNLKQNPGW